MEDKSYDDKSAKNTDTKTEKSTSDERTKKHTS